MRLLLIAICLASICAKADVKRFISLDNSPNGFELFRMERPDDREDFREVCSKGITEMMVLSGDAESTELKWADECPNMKVVYNEKQSARKPVTAKFLNYFDKWILHLKTYGIKGGIRCLAGSHRTGRLSSYYRMRFQKWDVDSSIQEMNEIGKIMWAFPTLDNQVRAIKNFIDNVECEEKQKYCVIE